MTAAPENLAALIKQRDELTRRIKDLQFTRKQQQRELNKAYIGKCFAYTTPLSFKGGYRSCKMYVKVIGVDDDVRVNVLMFPENPHAELITVGRKFISKLNTYEVIPTEEFNQALDKYVEGLKTENFSNDDVERLMWGIEEEEDD